MTSSMNSIHTSSFTNLLQSSHSQLLALTMPASQRLSRLLLLLALLLAATTHAVPLDALHALSFLQPYSSSPCLAVQVLGHRQITSSACSVDALASIRNVADVSVSMSPLSQIALTLDPAITLTDDDTKVTVQWEDAHTRVLSLEYHGLNDGDHARRELSLPSSESYPLVLQSDEAATIVEVDTNTLQVSLVGQVVYVDPSLCQLDATAASVCVLPLKLEDRGAPQVITNGSWRLLIRHDAVSNTDVLLGFDFPSSGTYSQANDGFRSFTWLANYFHDASFSGLWPELPRKPLPQEDRVLGPPVEKLNTETQYITSLHKKVGKKNSFFCTGSLIASRYVLTAAHCIDTEWVAVGTLKQSGKGGEMLKVIRQIPHPQYNPANFSYDVMVLELAKPSSRKRIRLYSQAQISATKATVMGYGLKKVGANNGSDVLRAVELPLAPSNEECAEKMKTSLDESSLCAGGEEGKDACFGDSGGPLVTNPGTNDQRMIGIVSSGFGCGVPGNYKLFTRVSTVVGFIYESIRPVVKAPEDDEPIIKTKPPM